MEENIDAWDLWRRVRTQWRVGGMGGRIGLDNTAVFDTADRMGFEINPVLFTKIQRLEQEELKDDSRRRKEAAEKDGDGGK